MQQDPGDGQLLFHAATPGVDALLAAVVEGKVGEQLLDARLALTGRHMPDTAIEIKVIFGAEALVESREFEQGAGACADLFALGARVKSEDAGLARGGFEQAEQQVDGGGLARAIRAEKAEDDAWWNGEGEMVHRANAAKVACQISSLDRRFSHRCLLCRIEHRLRAGYRRGAGGSD